MCEHSNPLSARLVCAVGLAPKARRKPAARRPLPTLAARYRGYRRCIEWGSR